MPTRFASVTIAALLLSAGAASAATVWDGVYSAAQADRGKAAFAASCAGCHGDDMTSMAEAPLSGQGFMDMWREDSLDAVFDKIRSSMPLNSASSVPDNTKLDVLAFILKSIDMPAGSKDLAADGLAAIQLVGKDGPKPLPTNSLTLTVGCLTGTGDNWSLTKATEPARARVSDATTPEEVKKSGTLAAGTQTFRLVNLEDARPNFKPADWQGHKVQLKGTLVRQRNGDRLTVGSIETLANTCQ